MHKKFLVTASWLGALAVALGAFGAHALKETLTAAQLNTYETAVRYQFYHVFALALTAVLLKIYPSKMIGNAARCFLVGIALFCGSLYTMIFLNLQQVAGVGWIGAITPFGGLFFILGWILLAIGVWRAEKA